MYVLAEWRDTTHCSSWRPPKLDELHLWALGQKGARAPACDEIAAREGCWREGSCKGGRMLRVSVSLHPSVPPSIYICSSPLNKDISLFVSAATVINPLTLYFRPLLPPSHPPTVNPHLFFGSVHPFFLLHHRPNHHLFLEKKKYIFVFLAQDLTLGILCCCQEGVTALHNAAKLGYVDAAVLLIEKGADIKQVDQARFIAVVLILSSYIPSIREKLKENYLAFAANTSYVNTYTYHQNHTIWKLIEQTNMPQIVQ